MVKRGRLITVEGVDGAGKSSHLPYIEGLLRANGCEVIVTREPGGTPLGEKLRALVLAEAMEPVAETLLMFAARADHVRKLIAPALERGAWVLCDRFTDATRAYQGAGKGVSVEMIERLAEWSHPGLRPDRTLIFDCPYDIALERLKGTGKALDRFERESRTFFDKVRGAYLERARDEPERVRIVDASEALDKIRLELSKHLVFH